VGHMLHREDAKKLLLLELRTAHEVAAFADKFAPVWLEGSPALRAVLFVFIDRGVRYLPLMFTIFHRLLGFHLESLRLGAFAVKRIYPSAFPIRTTANGKSTSAPPPEGCALVLPSRAQCPPSPTCLKLGLPPPVGCARYKG
jgi:hypothetical protein